MNVKLINYMQNPIGTMAIAVAKCYDSEPKESVVKGCIKKRHDSVTEHSMYVFEVSEVSRAFLAQVTRHRHLQFTVRSQRYTNESDFNYVTPDSIKESKASYIYKKFMKDCSSFYETLVNEYNIPKEDARFALPNATEVKMVISGNYRAWMKFCELREDHHTQWEIRKFAFEVDRLIHEVTPLTPFKELFDYKED